jgi:glutamine amidotransferase
MVGMVFKECVSWAPFRDLQHVAEIGAVPDQGDELPGHRDGWGIASFMAGAPRYVGRSERPVHLDPSYDSAVNTFDTLETPNILIAHARRGSEGSRSLENTHPFIGEGLVFAHNGTVKKFEPNTRHRAKGQTDSERLFMSLLDRIEEGMNLRSAVKALVREDVAGHEYTAVILMVSDGRTLLGYRGYHDERNSWYYNLKLSVCPGAVTMFQETVQGYPGEIVQIDNGELASVNMNLEVQRERLL